MKLRPASKVIEDVSMRDDSTAPEVKQPPIQLGQTRLSEYTKLSVLGKGTYGEVHKCVHTPTGLIVAMKTYIFEVSILLKHVERDQWDQLLNYARDQSPQTTSSTPSVRSTSRYFGR